MDFELSNLTCSPVAPEVRIDAGEGMLSVGWRAAAIAE
jgi:hypothetical protein